MSDKIQVRRDTTANWTSVNPVLFDGEIGYDKNIKAFKIGDGTTAWGSLPWSVNGAVINDGVTASGTTWSSTKIDAAITTAMGSTTTAQPALNSSTLSGNEGASGTLTITNYNAAFTYTLTSSNVGVFTASRSGATITINFQSVSSNTAATLNVTAMDSTKTLAANVQATITSYNVDVADTAIQITDFAASALVANNLEYV